MPVEVINTMMKYSKTQDCQQKQRTKKGDTQLEQLPQLPSTYITISNYIYTYGVPWHSNLSFPLVSFTIVCDDYLLLLFWLIHLSLVYLSYLTTYATTITNVMM